MAAVARRGATSTPSHGSRTVLALDAQPTTDPTGPNAGANDDSGAGSSTPAAGTLRLRGGPRENRRRVAWTEETVDNEGMGRKKSKICCIYHKPRAFDESSSESDSDSEDDSSGDDDGRARPSNLGGSRRNHHHHHHHPNEPCDGTREPDSGTANVHEVESDDEVNAYERMPKGKGKAPS